MLQFLKPKYWITFTALRFTVQFSRIIRKGQKNCTLTKHKGTLHKEMLCSKAEKAKQIPQQGFLLTYIYEEVTAVFLSKDQLEHIFFYISGDWE